MFIAQRKRLTCKKRKQKQKYYNSLKHDNRMLIHKKKTIIHGQLDWQEKKQTPLLLNREYTEYLETKLLQI